MVFKNLHLFTYVNLFSAGIVDTFPVNSSMEKVLGTTHESLSLISLLPIFQELKIAIHNKKETIKISNFKGKG